MIKSTGLEQILKPAGLSGEGIRVDLFIASKKRPQLKKLDLADLSPAERIKKLHNWSKDNRFVAVVEKGDMVYAFISPQFVESLQSQPDLAINGKKVSIKPLSEMEAKRLSSVAETFEEFVRLNPEEEIEDEQEEEKSEARRETSQNYLKESLARAQLLSGTVMDFLILQMRNVPEKIKLAFLKKMGEMRNEIDRRKKEQDIKDGAKHETIKHQDLKKRIVHDEVTREEIKEQNQKLEQVASSVKKGITPGQTNLEMPHKKRRYK
ncbi:MAG: hypothetical protein H0V82_09545 [Candidatus Protochlamydia sp.]|nr:hypothetical protein [Candidatus Protochlamydia sp.]